MMHPHLFTALFWIGLAAVVWVGSGFVLTNPVAFVMTLLIGLVYLFGAHELRQFRRATASLDAALAAIPESLPQLDDWLVRLHPSLQQAVRLRLDGERNNLPGPALTPYLVGLLVMLGMLGTFIGMVVTFSGAVFALEGTTDMAAMRSALTLPIKGLGLAFGTSVAGVAASALLGLLSALCRRERMQAGQWLDRCIATTALREHTRVWQRQQTEQLLQLQQLQQTEMLQATMLQLHDMNRQLADRLSGQQENLHTHMQSVYGELALRVDASLKDSLAQGARAAGESIRPVLETAVANVAGQTQSLLERMQAQSDELMRTRMTAEANWIAQQDERLTVWQDAWTERLGTQVASLGAGLKAALDEMRQQVSASLARDVAQIEERSRLLSALDGLLGSVERASVRLDEVGVQVAASAVDVACLGEAFQQTAAEFGNYQTQLVAQLQQTAVALKQSLTKSDDQLAYYVAQARDLIELSVLSQKEMVDALRSVSHPATLAEVA